MRKAAAALAVLATTFGVGGCGDEGAGASEESASDSSPAPETLTVSGYLDLISGSIYDRGRACTGADGYGDLTEGAQVTVYDASGTKIALGSLEEGDRIVTKGLMNPDPCRFNFTITDVPAEGSIFSIEVTSRGQIDFSKDEAQSIRMTLED